LLTKVDNTETNHLHDHPRGWRLIINHYTRKLHYDKYLAGPLMKYGLQNEKHSLLQKTKTTCTQ